MSYPFPYKYRKRANAVPSFYQLFLNILSATVADSEGGLGEAPLICFLCMFNFYVIFWSGSHLTCHGVEMSVYKRCVNNRGKGGSFGATRFIKNSPMLYGFVIWWVNFKVSPLLCVALTCPRISYILYLTELSFYFDSLIPT